MYRRWRDTAGLLMEVLNELASVEIPLTDTGSVDDDLRSLAIGIARFYGDRVAGSLAELREFWAHRNDRAAEPVRRAIERGDLPPDTDPIEVIRNLGAPLYYRMLVTHEPIDQSVAERAAATALTAARAGLLHDQGPAPRD